MHALDWVEYTFWKNLTRKQIFCISTRTTNGWSVDGWSTEHGQYRSCFVLTDTVCHNNNNNNNYHIIIIILVLLLLYSDSLLRTVTSSFPFSLVPRDARRTGCAAVFCTVAQSLLIHVGQFCEEHIIINTLYSEYGCFIGQRGKNPFGRGRFYQWKYTRFVIPSIAIVVIIEKSFVVVFTH